MHQLFPLCSLHAHLLPHHCQSKNRPRANNITDTRTPFSSCFCSHSIPSLDTQETLRSAEIYVNAFINVRLNILWTIDRTGAGSLHKKKSHCSIHRYSQNWLIPLAPRKSLTQLSKENVRLSCSNRVICHAKRFSFTSGDVSCRRCHTDLLSAELPLLSTQLPAVQFIPLSLCFSHTHLAIFPFFL